MILDYSDYAMYHSFTETLGAAGIKSIQEGTYLHLYKYAC